MQETGMISAYAELLAAKLGFDRSLSQRVREEVDAATDEAEKSPMPNGEDAGKGLFKGDGYW